jgi:hypothetical protein
MPDKQQPVPQSIMRRAKPSLEQPSTLLDNSIYMDRLAANPPAKVDSTFVRGLGGIDSSLGDWARDPSADTSPAPNLMEEHKAIAAEGRLSTEEMAEHMAGESMGTVMGSAPVFSWGGDDSSSAPSPTTPDTFYEDIAAQQALADSD